MSPATLMTSNPVLMARPSAVNTETPRNGSATKPPYKSILLKRKLEDGPDSDDRTTDKRRRVGPGGSRDYPEAGKDENKAAASNGSNDGEYDQDLDEGVVIGASKRQKTVHFDMNLNITTEVGRRTLEETKVSVRRALQSHSIAASRPGHDDQDYIELVDVFSHDKEPYKDPSGATNGSSSSRRRRASEAADDDDDDDDDDGNMVRPDDLVLYVVALSVCAPLLNKSCINLVRKLLACSWVGRDDKFVRAYVQCRS